MSNYLTEKLLFEPVHGKDCTLEVCIAGEPDADELIFKGTVSDCLRKSMDYTLPWTGDAYFSLTTNCDNYCGIDFEGLCWQMGHNPEDICKMLVPQTSSLDNIIRSAENCVNEAHTSQSAPSHDKVR